MPVIADGPAATAATTPPPPPARTEPPYYLQVDWVTGRLGVSQRHRLELDFRPDASQPHTYARLTHVKPLGEIPIWYSGAVYGSDAKTTAAVQSVRDAVLGSGLLKRPPSNELTEPRKPGEVQVTLGMRDGGIQDWWDGTAGKLPADMQQVFTAAQGFMKDVKPARKVSLLDLIKGTGR